MAADCIFCKIAGGEIPAHLLYQDEHCVAFADLHPQAPTHLLIIPRLHLATLNDLQPAHAPLIGQLFLAAQKLAADHGIADFGYRTVFNCNAGAGQSVWHLHLHLLGGRPMNWPPG